LYVASCCFFQKRNSSHFAQIVAAIADVRCASPEIWYWRFRETGMTSVSDHSGVTGDDLAELDEPLDAGFDRDVLQRARERQDKVHAALEIWFAATIAELAAER
jgi:hypothetical protein